ncbi:MAG: hypothetical protein JST73_12100 [Actinobacteria bacterium]|nr:hypothetical protein [Actinomycetota bacterium]
MWTIGFRIDRVVGTPANGRLDVTVTSASVSTPPDGHPAPTVGMTGSITAAGDVLTDQMTGIDACSYALQMQGTCGA